VTLTIGVNDAVVRHTEMPRLSADDMRLVLKHSSRTYLQQELANYIFDCHVMASPCPSARANRLNRPSAPRTSQAESPRRRRPQQLIDDFVEGARRAGFVAECIVPGLIGPVNAFEKAMPERVRQRGGRTGGLGLQELLDLHPATGELVLSRVLGIGGDKLTNGLAEALNVSYAEAEGN